MAQGIRPGGLTALAVVNFVLCGLGVLGAFGMIFTLHMSTQIEAELEREAQANGEKEDPAVTANRAQMRVLQENEGKVYIQAGLSVLESILFLLSGLGYLGQKRVMGRYLGTAVALLGLGAIAFQLTYLSFGLEHMTSIIYPLLTLVLVNTTFRHDLVN